MLLHLAQLLIGFFFLFSGFWNIYYWNKNINNLRMFHLPIPSVFLWIMVMWQIVAGGMIIFNLDVKIASLSLILLILITATPSIIRSYRSGILLENTTYFVTKLTVTIGALLALIVLHG